MIDVYFGLCSFLNFCNRPMYSIKNNSFVLLTGLLQVHVCEINNEYKIIRMGVSDQRREVWILIDLLN